MTKIEVATRLLEALVNGLGRVPTEVEACEAVDIAEVVVTRASDGESESSDDITDGEQS